MPQTVEFMQCPLGVINIALVKRRFDRTLVLLKTDPDARDVGSRWTPTHTSELGGQYG